jgi:hypothetical protein
MIDLKPMDLLKRRRLTALLGLALDGSRLEGLVLRRTNGSCQVLHPFSVSLSLDPLTNDPQLVGREIRNHLDALGVHERDCIVGLPLKWALVTHAEVPELSDADAASLLQIEAERGFPCDIQTLHVAISRCQAVGGKQQAIAVGIPRNHLALLEQALHAAKLKPVSFSLGITALQPPAAKTSEGVLALVIGETHVGLQVTCGGGIAALRALEGTLEAEGAQRVLHAEVVATQARITLGQFPTGIRDSIRTIRVFGPRDLAQQLVDELELRLDSMELKVERVTRHNASEFSFTLPPDAPVSPAFSLAAERLSDRGALLEFLPPKVTPWQQMSAKYASGKLRTVLSAAGAVGLVVGALFSFQQFQLWRLQSQWGKIEPNVRQLKTLEGKIKLYRPWFDESVRALTILRRLTEVFPEDGTVTAKTVEIRDLNLVTCTGTARNYQALLRTVEHLRSYPQTRDVNLGPARGQSPALQFSFTFHWNEGGRNAN